MSNQLPNAGLNGRSISLTMASSFASVIQQRKINQLGRAFVNGKPLPRETRRRIIELAYLGFRACDISKRLKVTHGCISKLLAKYRRTGSLDPAQPTGEVKRSITPTFMQNPGPPTRQQPSAFSWEMRDPPPQEKVCGEDTIPSVTSIIRHYNRNMDAAWKVDSLPAGAVGPTEGITSLKHNPRSHTTRITTPPRSPCHGVGSQKNANETRQFQSGILIYFILTFFVCFFIFILTSMS